MFLLGLFAIRHEAPKRKEHRPCNCEMLHGLSSCLNAGERLKDRPNYEQAYCAYAIGDVKKIIMLTYCNNLRHQVDGPVISNDVRMQREKVAFAE